MSSPAVPVALDRNAAARWGQAHLYGPAPRHRRRMLIRIVARLDVRDVLDAGCAQPLLLEEIAGKLGLEVHGCDISDEVIRANAKLIPKAEFRVLDLAREVWPDNKQFDLVVSSETLEHIEQWRDALGHLVSMSRRYVLLTVPSGRIRPVDRLVGHHQHFAGPELAQELERRGCRILLSRKWGFPVHSAYRAAVERFGSDRIYETFGEHQEYGPAQRALAKALYWAFFTNYPFRRGSQLIVVAQKDR